MTRSHRFTHGALALLVAAGVLACEGKSKRADSPPAAPSSRTARPAARPAAGGARMNEAVFHEILERLYLAIDKRLGELTKLKDEEKRKAGIRELRPASPWTARQRKRILAELGVSQKELTAWILTHRAIVKKHGERHAKRLAAAFQAYGFVKDR